MPSFEDITQSKHNTIYAIFNNYSDFPYLVSTDGTIIGIDICRFNSDDLARDAASIRSRHTYSSIFNSNDLPSIDVILEEWEKDIVTFTSKKHNLSAITVHGSTVVHIYQYHPIRVNTEIFSSVAKQFANQLPY